MSEHHAEIIIIKRKGGHEDGHHGGAWKIAFADFMTAMMAFFLVLWIINATDKDTKTVIARYFNPVKLENPARAKKGVHGVDASNPVSDEIGEQSPGSANSTNDKKAKDDKGASDGNPTPAKKDEKKDEKKEDKKEDKKKDKEDKNKSPPHPELPVPAEVRPNMAETALFSDPYQSLDRIASGDASMSPAVSPNTGSSDPTREAGATSVEAFRDPFKPVGPGVANDVSMTADTPPPPAPNQQADLEPQKGEVQLDPDRKPAPLMPAPMAPGDAVAAASPPPNGKPLEGKPQDAKAQEIKSQDAKAQEAKPLEVKPAEAKAGAPTPVASGTPAPVPSAGATPLANTAIVNQVAKDLQRELGSLAKSAEGPGVDVRSTDEGLLISLTDKLSFSMFALGSAEPRAEVIRAMNAIAQVLKAHPGMLILRGHTDGRQYRSATYDNWRLSSARAQMAYYMLTRAGIPEARFDRVEGHADRSLRDVAHPLAAENRRIEILLRGAKT